ncbi:hypothetical protein [Actinokineospora sp. NBRC 105648]|uniref:hypothetical protein n=1 Tax=Actinokineospora sp. NBRC 105648 TaxID=3032206 RepID=UPI00255495D6|nr:hypothetical protein [Actinokineospora sp. NBRC 105648]
MRRYFLEGFLAGAGAAASGTVAVHSSSIMWGVIAVLLGGVAIACFAASFRSHPVSPSGPAEDAAESTHVKRRPRRLGSTRLFGSSPSTTVAPTPPKGLPTP